MYEYKIISDRSYTCTSVTARYEIIKNKIMDCGTYHKLANLRCKAFLIKVQQTMKNIQNI